jgi:myo-inositol 2-dehydrogenase/D-chiro-inositol 1-dehydrogenase
MRLGLIGLGRIGAFHARTLTELPAVDSLVVTDAQQAATERSSPTWAVHGRGSR